MSGKNRSEKIIEETLDRCAVYLTDIFSDMDSAEIRSIISPVFYTMKCPKILKNGQQCKVILCPHHGNSPLQKCRRKSSFNIEDELKHVDYMEQQITKEMVLLGLEKPRDYDKHNFFPHEYNFAKAVENSIRER